MTDIKETLLKILAGELPETDADDNQSVAMSRAELKAEMLKNLSSQETEPVEVEHSGMRMTQAGPGSLNHDFKEYKRNF
jgi:hypothetical protein